MISTRYLPARLSSLLASTPPDLLGCGGTGSSLFLASSSCREDHEGGINRDERQGMAGLLPYNLFVGKTILRLLSMGYRLFSIVS